MMPEGPEVRTLVDQLQPAVGKRLTDLKFLSGRYSRSSNKPTGYEEFRQTMTHCRTDDIPVMVADGDGNGGDKTGSSLHDEGEDERENQRSRGHEIVDVIKEWNAKGKFIYVILDNGNKHAKDNTNHDDDDYLRSIWITLGMTGRFASDRSGPDVDTDQYIRPPRSLVQQPRWVMEFMDVQSQGHTSPPTKRKIFYYDTRNFGTLRFSLSRKELENKLAKLGPDLLQDCDESTFLSILESQRQTTNISKLLMNQSKICGIGNYILAEGLYRANIDPFASLHEIHTNQRKNLFWELRSVITDSYRSQGLTRQKGGSYRQVDGHKGTFEFSLQVYQQEYCPKGYKVIRDTNGPHGRTIWFVKEQLFIPLSERFNETTNKNTNQKNSIQNGDSRNEIINFQPEYHPSVSSGGENTPPDLLESLTSKGWNESLTQFFASEKFQQLSKFIASERKTEIVYPPARDVFAALNICPLENVNVVIIGQDPYHGPGQGHGLAFSVQKDVTNFPPSLKNIFKEVVNNEGIAYPKHGNLSHWAEQGVLLLNTVLTVRKGEPKSHSGKGWEDFTDEIVQIINKERDGVIFLLWGNDAAQKANRVDTSRHVIIKTSHPSPLGATKTKSPFLGSSCFSECNRELLTLGKQTIDW
eukprot:CAMPEP_0184858616 /NCGR_PEP_ID=MMETSP0580-20130426/3697_1 /TAXON_ID=1118495 /ORGANISM="Dactyliosolen fragilissimus" /LENGTH=639 /DNA_ID=CAMNT_0027354857 /DNA_START=674 /DNA_END=2590 /DNA_ORIENTATION=+